MAEVQTVRAGENTAAANAAGKAAMNAGRTKFPDAPAPESDMVHLPCGLRHGQDVLATARVKELDGTAEEALARAAVPDPATGQINAFHYLNTLLEQGTAQIGDAELEDTRKLLKQLLIGDRDAILIGIRVITFGPDVELLQWACPACGDLSDLTINLAKDVEVIKMQNPDESVFTVDLSRGKVAAVRLPNGEDQMAIGANTKATSAERSTIMLQRCVSTITDSTGRIQSMAGFPSLAREMSIPDRRKVLKEISDRQPGPQFDAVKLVHEGCGKEVTVSLGIVDLFLSGG